MWKEYSEILETYDYFFHYEPRLILKDFSFIPKVEGPDEVLENYKNRLEESKIIHAKYCTNYKVKEDEYNLFDMVKSWYLPDYTMCT